MDVRGYVRETDFEPVGRMLVESYRRGDVYDPWLQPRWEYMHFHPFIWDQDLTTFGVAEDGGEIVGVVHLEDHAAFGYLQRRPGRDDAVEPLLDWAEAHLGGPSRTFERDVLGLYAAEFDHFLREALARRGFVEHPEHGETHSRLTGIADLAPQTPPDGYELRTLADDNDLVQIERVLWRGFDHEGPPPDGGVDERRFAQSAPSFRPDLTTVVVAPDGTYAAYCGMWVVPENRIAYVEPVATDPDHRRLGLGSVAVLEACRRAGAAGADVAWVGTDLPFYLALGFEPMFASTLWVR
jgi:predicted N-acetyltransferase YhbS